MMGTPAADVKIKAWTPAILCKIQDNIVSSKFANAKVFLPSYECTKVRPSMEQLLANEYQRVWWEEKEAWDKKFSRKTVSKTLLQRKVIPRRPPTKAKVLQVPKRAAKTKNKVESPINSKLAVLKKKSTGSVKPTKSKESLQETKDSKEEKAMVPLEESKDDYEPKEILVNQEETTSGCGCTKV